ncbi:uncharacterized protein DSM5745_06367 [Aspergillus mulundensis]|uniref:Uncharacterized protein n=1 Tax=Aspergillus mulundensis TaxID=1810919 RepID=A0A3D8RQV7_9EURO|nr:hypothetical protein DSM5745_06367 [Aspergillus mulundensis]RDW76375.1 hypothetical protein DSM5745_06367 [Aspergillus mulundensis]
MPPRPLKLSASALRSTRHLRTGTQLRSISVTAQAIGIQRQTPKLKFPTVLVSSPGITPLRQFSATPLQSSPTASPSAKDQADAIVEQLQDLANSIPPPRYETAKDEFEIATESTDDSTIYAASDRESARDALNDLIIAYELYTGSTLGTGTKEGQAPREEQSVADANKRESVLENILEIDPNELTQEARDMVKKRVGQRLRELKSAVEALEARAHD